MENKKAEAITAHDKSILRELAKKQLEYANSPRNDENIRLWYKHNSCEGERPMIHLELGTFCQEVIPKRLRCVGEAARGLETALYHNILNFEVFEDDRPVTPYFPVATGAYQIPFGLNVPLEAADTEGGVGFRFLHPMTDLEKDFHMLSEGEIICNREHEKARFDMASELFGDILPAKRIFNCIGLSPTQSIVRLMGMEQMFLSMYDYPELFHKMMAQYANDTLRLFDYLESENLVLSTTGAEALAQGSWCFSTELPSHDAGRSLSVSDVWGYLDSQETVGLSPDMYAEFIFPYYKTIAECFGLLSYGCCEPVHSIWDNCLSTLTNLRKVSISAWCDEEFMGERLQGKKIIFHRKPSPNFLGVGSTLDEPAFADHIRRTLKAARGLPLEIAQRDVYTINNDEDKARRYISLIREVIETDWQA